MGQVVHVDSCHHTGDVGKAEVSSLWMGLTNTVVLRGKRLEGDVLVLPIRGAFRRIARVETVPEAIHMVQIVVGLLVGAHPRSYHPNVLRPNGRPQTPVEFLTKGCPRLFNMRVRCRRCYAFGCMVTIRGGYRMARGWHYTKLSLLSSTSLVSSSGMCFVVLFHALVGAL